jgi:hypothetical protein
MGCPATWPRSDHPDTAPVRPTSPTEQSVVTCVAGAIIEPIPRRGAVRAGIVDADLAWFTEAHRPLETVT